MDSNASLMKNKEPVKAKRTSASPSRQRAKRKVAVHPVLPDWVIGAYDGPKDKKLSLKEGYAD